MISRCHPSRDAWSCTMELPSTTWTCAVCQRSVSAELPKCVLCGAAKGYSNDRMGNIREAAAAKAARERHSAKPPSGVGGNLRGAVISPSKGGGLKEAPAAVVDSRSATAPSVFGRVMDSSAPALVHCPETYARSRALHELQKNFRTMKYVVKIHMGALERGFFPLQDVIASMQRFKGDGYNPMPGDIGALFYHPNACSPPSRSANSPSFPPYGWIVLPPQLRCFATTSLGTLVL